MKVKEFLQNEKVINKGHGITFTIAKAVKDERTPFYHNEFHQTPIRYVCDWKDGELMDYIILNPSACPIDISGTWQNWFMRGSLANAIITTEKDLYTMYNEKQAKETIEWYDKQVREKIKEM